MYHSLINIDTLFDCYDAPVLLEASIFGMNECQFCQNTHTHTYTYVRTCAKIRCHTHKMDWDARENHSVLFKLNYD